MSSFIYFLALLNRLAAALTILLFIAVVATVWATHKAVERTDCYLSARSVSDCAQPDGIELIVRRIFA